MSKILASKLRNRIEIWERVEIETDLGVNYTPKLFKKVWGNVTPITGYLESGEGNTEYSDTTFRIRIRKVKISMDNWIEYHGSRYDIKYIHEDFKSNKFIDLFVNLNEE